MQDPLGARRNLDVVTLAASLGGLGAPGRVPGGLPDDLPAPVRVVQHHAAGSPGIVESALRRRSRRAVGAARDGDLPAPGRVMVPGGPALFGPRRAVAWRPTPAAPPDGRRPRNEILARRRGDTERIAGIPHSRRSLFRVSA